MPDASLIDGKAFAANLRARIGRQVAALKARDGLTPGLAAVLVGDDPASQIYVRNKEKQTAEAGMASVGQRLDVHSSQDDLLSVVRDLNADPAVHGILVQLPLPGQIDPRAIIDAINPAKDVDGFHPINVGRLASGEDALVPCTPLGCTMLLKDVLGDLTGTNAVIVGRSNIVGKPMAQLLLAENCTVTVAHSRTKDLPAVCRDADILIAAVGRPQMIRGDWIKPGATVIDVGINRIEKEDGKTRLVGDVAFDEAIQVAGAITPVPGGVGPMTIACLLQNTLVACCRLHGVDVPDDPGA
ncbi:MAG: bifunctional methylenetetrahydrofolate dehydrogenase/methenyltetrahydrofolate cyclohydrolase FolD [Rhodospirillaceae bacterium]|jgi:methylenetetrahydrofolate dehydrogenase (NADP+) / methenyltetrahydrofolate cyclohydrolase|nr:bifunctional methylenetetrahydrofolate dehydrogenase/methenyltetrahydrofolate cyclohydrolase FolD [Rhodospirillaceae bacterium]MBT5455647.1 bifunctional methylenetetrahydrofolate dehydrogenase/methenyltetrahydrofolate cyclohydrolase FolD [Rhodospirillaceae bacterium]